MALLSRLLESCKSEEGKLQFIKEITKDAGAVQGQVLAEILSQNAETEYLMRFGLDGAIDRRSYKEKIPIVDYEDLREDIERIAGGDPSRILSGHPISEFNTSSGTSGGKRKLIPTIKDDLHRKLFFCSSVFSIISQYIPGVTKQNLLNFVILKPETKTSGGHPARSVLSAHYKFLIENNMWTGISPAAAVLCPDYFQSMYVQTLCGLYHRHEVMHIKIAFASGVIHTINFLRQNWSQLVTDISTGVLTNKITDQLARDSVSRLLKPDSELFRFLTDQFSSADWSGIITKIWPNAKCLQSILTGSMSQYIPMLRFYCGELPIVSMEYASSECFFGLNLNPICDPSDVQYTLLTNMAYFEFILQDPEGLDTVVDLANVEVGKEYELVITTYAGLYRYRVGDIVLVTGFHNTAPTVKFVRRKNVVLSIDADKTNEVELQMAVESVAKLLRPLKVNIVDYTTYADTKSVPGHYVTYLEFMVDNHEDNEITNEMLERCCLVMEESLNAVYRQCRVADGSIGPLEIRVLKGGAFEEVMQLAVSQGASVAQYKAPKCVKVGPVLELLESRVVSAHFSPACPKWSPHQSI